MLRKITQFRTQASMQHRGGVGREARRERAGGRRNSILNYAMLWIIIKFA